MPQDLRGPPQPELEGPSLAENIRGVMLGIGELGMAIGSDGSSNYDSSAYDSSGDSRPAKSWWGRILQWAWALIVFLVGLAVLALFVLLGIGWVMDFFS